MEARQYQEKLHAAIANSMDGVALLDAEGKYYYLNDTHIKMFGYEEEIELIGKTWRDIYDSEEIKRIENEIFPLLMSKGHWRGETRGKNKQGKIVYQEISLTILSDGGIICICRDITEMIANRNRLLLHDNILKSTGSMVIITNMNRETQWVNASFCRVTGYTLEEVIGKKPGVLLQGPKTDKEIISRFKDALNNNLPFNCELCNYSKNGTEYWVEVKSQPLYDHLGRQIGFFAIEEDITERKKNQNKYETILEATGGVMWEWDILHDKVSAENNFAILFGFESLDQMELSYAGFKKLTHPDDLVGMEKATEINIHTQMDLIEYEFRQFKPNENRFCWFQIKGRITERDEYGRATKAMGACFNINQLKVAEEKLIDTEARWNFALDGSGFGVWDLDVEQKTIFFSNKLKELYGYNNNELDPSIEFWVESTHPDDKPKMKHLLDSINKGVNEFNIERRIIHRNGTVRWFHSRGKVIKRNTDGAPQRVIGSVVDTTDNKKMEKDLIIAKELAENMVKTKRRFLANTSHELRTPLHAIIGLSEQLESQNLNNEQKAYASIIKDSAKHLVNLISDVLDLSKIEEEKLQLVLKPFNIASIIRDAASIIESSAVKKNVKLEVVISNTSNNDWFKGDELRLRQILINLLSNAVKFTESGWVRIEYSVSPLNQKHRTICIKVSDTGIGINEKRLNHIFEDFIQGDKTYSRKYGGSGLGLAICKNLVRLMGGVITVKSEENYGTEFSINLPMEICEFERDLPEEKNQVASLNENAKVLLVEDNNINRLVAKLILKKNGVVPDEAVNGKEAIEKLSAGSKYDLILMDIQMPEMDGVETVQYIRNKLHINTPIIAITANAVKEELEYYMFLGMNDVITKPFEEKLLIDKIGHFINQTSSVK